MKLERDFYTRDTLIVAKELLGKLLVRNSPEGIVKGKIVEVEAYVGSIDKACHAYNDLRSKRTEIMYKNGGHAYVFMIYGMYSCMNVVTNKENLGEAVLIRALEPIDGIELMKKRRNTEKIKNLTNGPGKLCKALDITKELSGTDLCSNTLYIEDYETISEENIISSKRINIEYAEEAKDFLWRFTIKDNPFISQKIK